MKPIKTCYGEWVNPALVKYFSVRRANYDERDAYVVYADGVTLQVFKVEVPPDCPKEPAGYDQNKRKTRAEACAWLADFIKETFDEAD